MNTKGLDGKKLPQVRNFERHFYLSSFRRALNSTLDRMFSGTQNKNRIS